MENYSRRKGIRFQMVPELRKFKVNPKWKSYVFQYARCDVYIGTGAGKKLMEEMEQAQRSVKIVSPFLSPFLVQKLIELHYNGIEIQLITTDTIEDYYGGTKKDRS